MRAMKIWRNKSLSHRIRRRKLSPAAARTALAAGLNFGSDSLLVMKQGDEGEEKRPISLIRLAIFGNVVAQQRPEQKASPYSFLREAIFLN